MASAGVDVGVGGAPRQLQVPYTVVLTKVVNTSLSSSLVKT
jgi:hypothetical protein